MYDKPVEEIRERRKKLLTREFKGSIKKFGREARKWEKEHPEKVVNLRESKKSRKISNY